MRISDWSSDVCSSDLNLGLTYVDTLYRRNLVGSGGRPLSPVLFQLPGRGVSNAAKYVATAGVSWTPPIGDSGLSALVYFDTRLQSATNTGSDLAVEKRSEERSVGKECVSTGRSWGSPDISKTKNTT